MRNLDQIFSFLKQTWTILIVCVVKKYVSPFYTELIKTWIICNKKTIKEPKQYFQVRKQIIWGNKCIKHKGKSLMIENWINSGIIFINNIIDDQGNISEVVILQNLICKQNWCQKHP